jgi:hypothetical protein
MKLKKGAITTTKNAKLIKMNFPRPTTTLCLSPLKIGSTICWFGAEDDSITIPKDSPAYQQINAIELE